MTEHTPPSAAKPPPLVDAGVVIVLALLCYALAGCANIPVRRTYSLGYGKASASITLEPASWDTLHHEGKTVVAPKVE